MLLDSHVPNYDHGQLAPESRRLLEQAAANDESLVVALHHPPLKIGSGRLDPIRLLDPRALMAPLHGRDAPSVVLCGHAHTPLSSSLAGVPVRIAPGIASTLRLPHEPHSDTLDREAPPGLALHYLDEDSGELHTHIRCLGA